MALSAAGFRALAVSVCSNGVAQTVPVVSDLATMGLSRRGSCRSTVCRSPPPRSRLPVWEASTRPRRGKAVPRPGVGTEGASLRTLVLALSYGSRRKRADRLIKHPWELEARSGGCHVAHESLAEQAMPPGPTPARGWSTRRARAPRWPARLLLA